MWAQRDTEAAQGCTPYAHKLSQSSAAATTAVVDASSKSITHIFLLLSAVRTYIIQVDCRGTPVNLGVKNFDPVYKYGLYVDYSA